MKSDSKLAKKIESGDFIVSAEHVPGITAAGSATEAALKALGGKPVVVNMSDNSHGVAMSSVAALFRKGCASSERLQSQAI